MSDEVLLLDACVVINLYATRFFGDIARANDVRFAAVDEVVNETFFVADAPPDGARTQADLLALEEKGELLVITLNEQEKETFVELAADLDEGEAATLAAAIHRRLPVATDDRRALRLIRERALPITVVRTSTLIRRWAERRGLPREEVVEVLRSVETRASFIPPADDPEHAWWRARVDAEADGVSAPAGRARGEA